MTRYLLIAVALGGCALAVADVRVFVTSSASGYGLDLLGPQGDGTGTDPEHEDYPIDPLRPTYSTVSDYGWEDFYAYDYYYAYYRAAAYPPIDAPSGTVDDPILIDAAVGEWAHIWFQFRGEPFLAKVNEMITIATLAGEAAPTQDLTFTYYVQNDLGNPDRSGKRWWGDASPPGYPEWRMNPQHFLAPGAWGWGLVNEIDNPQRMFDQQEQVSGTGVALLGAVTGAPSDAVYELKIDGIGYANYGPPQIAESTFFKIVPEPAGVLAGLVVIGWMRGRRS